MSDVASFCYRICSVIPGEYGIMFSYGAKKAASLPHCFFHTPRRCPEGMTCGSTRIVSLSFHRLRKRQPAAQHDLANIRLEQNRRPFFRTYPTPVCLRRGFFVPVVTSRILPDSSSA